MTRIRVVIADDEAPARNKVRRFLRGHTSLELVGEAASGTEALRLIREARPELLLLDVQMPAPDGFGVIAALAEAGERVPHVVFLTAYDAYAVQAFDVNALDYLLKPFDEERFARAMERAETAIRAAGRSDEERLLKLLEQVRRGEPYLERLLVHEGDRSLLLRVAEIDWIEAAQNYVTLHVSGRSYTIRGTMRELETRLDPHRFARIHRSYIVNLDRVRELHAWSHGDYQVVLADGTRLMLSRRFRDRLPSVAGS